MTATVTTLATTIDTKYEPGFVDELYRYSKLLGLNANGRPLFPQAPTGGGTSVNWKVHTTGQTPEVYTEGQATPVPGNQTYVNAQLAPTFFRVMTEVTGHLEAALSDLAAFFDAIGEEVNQAQLDLFSLIETSFMGASYGGLQAAVSATTTYAGITRGSASYWESVVEAVSTALSLAKLEDNAELQLNATKGGRLGLLLAAPNQLTNYSRLCGVVGASNAAPRVNLSAPGGGLDLGYNMDGLFFRGAPIVGMPGLTDTVWLGIDITQGIWAHRIHQKFMTKFQGRNGDANQFHHSFASCIQCRRPKRHFKLTGVTA